MYYYSYNKGMYIYTWMKTHSSSKDAMFIQASATARTHHTL